MKRFYTYLAVMAAILLAGSCNRVDESESNFDNVAYMKNADVAPTVRIALKANATTERTISAALALPETRDIQVTFKADRALVDAYGRMNGLEVQPLPDSCFSLPETRAVITAGDVQSPDVTVYFEKLTGLPNNINFVLPVTIDNAGISVLKGAKTIYYVLRRGAIISVAANITDNYFSIPGMATSHDMDDLPAVTFEGWVRPRALPNNVNTFMGIEAYSLIRFGDQGYPANRAQFCGAWTDLYLTIGVWQHVAFVYNVADTEVNADENLSVSGPTRLKAYLNGELVWEGPSDPANQYGGGLLSLGYKPVNGGWISDRRFFIGRSVDDGRDFTGDMCELRIWGTVRTQEEIAASMYEVDPDSEGLLAYWKIDEGDGDTVKDYSGHGLDGVAANKLTWIAVELPAGK
jgi:hypothetical protein